MAKITILGDALQIKSDLTRTEIERVTALAPTALKLFDKDGNEVFGIGLGDASACKYGVCFCSEDSQGKVFMTAYNSHADHSDPDAEKAAILEEFAPILNKLNAIEAQVADARTAINEMEAALEDSVVFAE